jgi:hypothetical protein
MSRSETYLRNQALISLPRWNEIFFGRHKNKISFVATLRKLNYHFFYTLTQFLVHQEHDFSLYKRYDFEDHNRRMESAFHHQLMQVKDTKSRFDEIEMKIDIQLERTDISDEDRLKFEDLEEFVF